MEQSKICQPIRKSAGHLDNEIWKKACFGEKQTDQQMKSVNLEKENDVDSVKYTTWTDQKGKEQNYRIIEYNGLQTDLKEGVRVYRTGTSDLIFQYECKTAGGMISEVKFSDIDGNPGLSFKVIEKYESNELGKGVNPNM